MSTANLERVIEPFIVREECKKKLRGIRDIRKKNKRSRRKERIG